MNTKKGPRQGVWCPVCKVWLKRGDGPKHGDHSLALQITILDRIR